MQCSEAISKETYKRSEPKKNFSVHFTHIQNTLTDSNNKKKLFKKTILQFTTLIWHSL